MTKKLRRVPKDKKTGVPKKYLSGSKNKSAKAAEIKRTSELYKKGSSGQKALRQIIRSDGTEKTIDQIKKEYKL